MKLVKLSAFFFVVSVTILTVTYIWINLQTLNPDYLGTLAGSATANVIALVVYSLQHPKWKHSISWITIALIIIIGASVKTIPERSLPGKEVDDFIFTIWKFKDSWGYISKFLWHLTIDLFVLVAVVGIKRVTWPKEQKTS